MCSIDAHCRLHAVEHLRGTRFKAPPIPDPVSANKGYILEKIIDPVVWRYKTPYVSGCITTLPLNFLWSFLDVLLRPGLHHALSLSIWEGRLGCLLRILRALHTICKNVNMCPIDAHCRLHAIEHIRDTRFKAPPIYQTHYQPIRAIY